MKSPMVSKCRKRAPTDTSARLVITAAEAREYPTSTIGAMLVSRRRATAPPGRSRCVLAMAGRCPRGSADHSPQETTGPRRGPVTLAELTVAEHDRAADA